MGMYGRWVFGVCGEFIEFIEGDMGKGKAPPHGTILTN